MNSIANEALMRANPTVWMDKGDFFEEATESTDPVQGCTQLLLYCGAFLSCLGPPLYHRSTNSSNGHGSTTVCIYDRVL